MHIIEWRSVQFVCTGWGSTVQLNIGKQEERAITAWCNSRARNFGLRGPRAWTAKLGSHESFVSGWQKLAHTLTKQDILELDGKQVSLRQSHCSVACHAVVMQGELVSDYCPRCYKVTTCKRVCTRQTFVQRTGAHMFNSRGN